ncbi:unnamed protein product [Phaedon cochleariae]|uniref:Retinoblastoma-like protein 1 n=1 Tax=Phaedon cochleariae TaxID=80249 RepID=A0A9P0GT40_PHACE|nr:unnamed protein product [Phaedon cochleariae]
MGDAIHWLGCAVFVATQSVETPTLQSDVVKGNCLNLTCLLRHSNLSFVQFFSNITKWADMAHLPVDFTNKITHLKDNFNVAHNTFKEYYPMFSKIFLPPSSQDLEQSKPHRNRKQRPVNCNTSKVFEFIWNLFITLKAEHPQYSTELIKSYHLLYACIDLAFKNAFLAERRDLLNPQFECLPSDWNNPAFELLSDAPCIISYLCKCPSMLTEAMHVKMYILKRMIINLVSDLTLIASEVDFTGIFDNEVFEQNFRNISNAYETHLLNKADIDERIFLAEYRRQLLEQQQNSIGQSVKATPFSETGENATLFTPKNNYGTANLRGSDTPLTGRGFLGPREADICPLPVDRTATQKITRLHNILNNRSAGPSEALLQLFESCQSDPRTKIQGIVSTFGDKFISAYIEAHPNSEEDARNRLQIGITLFYKFTENILQNEKAIRPDISVLVEKDLFYQCMFACCLEIVLFCYNCPNKFPWVAEVLNVEPLHFVKVIELIVRTKDQLSREMIKYLNMIEETVLESLVWKSGSLIWEAIAASGQTLPKFADTALPGHLLYDDSRGDANIQSAEVTSSSAGAHSPPPPSATDRFESPRAGGRAAAGAAVQPGQSLLQRQTHIMITDQEGHRNLIIVNSNNQSQTVPSNLSDSTSQLPRRTGSLSIIFRKFYNLAGVRMEHLCNKVGFTDTELKRKIWTVFEDSIRNSDLIKDRHLDQLLMCAIYVICRISNIPLKFQDIMKFYREQPQSSSNVYRDVLLTKKINNETGMVAEKRSDLITFYNSIYVEVMQKFAVRFRSSSSSQNNNILLSPLPAIKRDLVSPSLQVVGNVYVRPLESPSTTSGSSFNYFFSRSPSKDLKDINKLVNSSRVTGKRLLIEGELKMDTPPSKRISNRKLQSLVEERKRQNIE